MKKIILAFLHITLPLFFAKAQTLPSIQTESLIIPATMKVDGKSDEWGNNFQAYNKPTNIYYSIANNSEILYVIIQSTDPLISKKIIGGGITFTFNPSGKRNDNKGASLEFPLLELTTSNKINSSINRMLRVKNAHFVDSVNEAINKQLVRSGNEIKISGIKEVKDSLISVYNDYQIKVLALFEKNGTLTYELTIPLTRIGITSKSTKIAYNIMLNGMEAKYKKVVHESSKEEDAVVVTAVPNGSVGNAQADFMTLNYPTDLWGYYIIKGK